MSTHDTTSAPVSIKDHYLNKGLSRRAYADQIGVPEQSLRRLEAGLGVHPANAKKVADDMKVAVTDILGAAAPGEAA
ncbi:helix-turn-helix domain-containing protein [Paraconexibacter algicola]|uniref:HTH cro/C1-type domain-containing protein n=1 Tax=Paraconexibacter algicola TaxID=2133960 RepID=A0A2T4UE28_9ACTN|nr:helix-turn-helix transcriptional regulator [Paraconexibacter algicola]PTL55766.1 hypothetical protein C7Y72_19245 [Paraconexibacter algicola]